MNICIRFKPYAIGEAPPPPHTLSHPKREKSQNPRSIVPAEPSTCEKKQNYKLIPQKPPIAVWALLSPEAPGKAPKARAVHARGEGLEAPGQEDKVPPGHLVFRVWGLGFRVQRIVNRGFRRLLRFRRFGGSLCLLGRRGAFLGLSALRVALWRLGWIFWGLKLHCSEEAGFRAQVCGGAGAGALRVLDPKGLDSTVSSRGFVSRGVKCLVVVGSALRLRPNAQHNSKARAQRNSSTSRRLPKHEYAATVLAAMTSSSATWDSGICVPFSTLAGLLVLACFRFLKGIARTWVFPKIGVPQSRIEPPVSDPPKRVQLFAETSKWD